jgi:hypothetical protein
MEQWHASEANSLLFARLRFPQLLRYKLWYWGCDKFQFYGSVTTLRRNTLPSSSGCFLPRRSKQCVLSIQFITNYDATWCQNPETHNTFQSLSQDSSCLLRNPNRKVQCRVHKNTRLSQMKRVHIAMPCLCKSHFNVIVSCIISLGLPNSVFARSFPSKFLCAFVTHRLNAT